MKSLPKYHAMQLAPFFIGLKVTPLKLQKLLYYSQVWYFVKHGNKLFIDDIKAWMYGPVVPDVWATYKYVRNSDIIPSSNNNITYLDPNVKDHLYEVWSAYGHLSGAQLVDLTHSEKPWLNSRQGILNYQPSNNTIIIDSATTSQFNLSSGRTIPKITKVPSLGHFFNT